jgi:hypothetical protein
MIHTHMHTSVSVVRTWYGTRAYAGAMRARERNARILLHKLLNSFANIFF